MYTVSGNVDVIKDIKVIRMETYIVLKIEGHSAYFDGDYENGVFQIHDNNDLESTMVNGVLQRNKNSCTVELGDDLTGQEIFRKKEYKKLTFLIMPKGKLWEAAFSNQLS